MNIDVTVSIVTYNNAETIEPCLDSIPQAIGNRTAQIVVVDNASSDDTVALLERRDDIELVPNRTNLGFGAAHNRAFAVARGRYFVCLNPDAYLQPAALQRFVETLDHETRVGLAGGRIYRPDGSPRANCARVTDGIEFILRNGLPTPSRILSRFPPEVWDCPEQLDVPAVVGACFVFRSAAFAEIGGFDEAFFMYHEGPDVALRMRQHGWRIMTVPEAGIVHVGNGSRQALGSIRSRMRASSLIYARKHLRPRDAWLYSTLSALSAAARLDDILEIYLRARRALGRHANS